MSRHKNQNKKLKKWRYVYRKIYITQRFDIEDSHCKHQRDSQIRLVEVIETTYGEAL